MYWALIAELSRINHHFVDVVLSSAWAIIIQVITSFLTTGVVYGWPGLITILNNQRLFADLCLPSEIFPDCENRVAEMTRAYTFGVGGNAVSYLIYGFALDMLGPRKTSAIGLASNAIGNLLFGFGLLQEKTWLIQFGFLLIGSGGVAIHVSSFHLCNLYPASKATLLSMFAGVFNAAGVLYAVLLPLSDADVPAHMLFFGLAVVGCALFAAVFLYQTDVPHPQPPRVVVQASDVTNPLALAGKTMPFYGSLSLLDSVKQIVFWAAALFMIISVNRISFYVGTLTRQIRALSGDIPAPEIYGTMALYVLPMVSFVLFPIPGRIMDKFGISGTIFLCNVLHLIWGLLAVIPKLPIQIATIIVFGIARLFTFATYFALIGVVFGPEKFGRLSGLPLLIAGLLVLSHTYIIKEIVHLGSHYAIPNLIAAALAIPVSVLPFILYKRGKSQLEDAAALAEAAATKEPSYFSSSPESLRDAVVF